LLVFQPETGPLPVYSTGFRKVLKYVKDKYANPEIIIMENGNQIYFFGSDFTLLKTVYIFFNLDVIFLGYGENLKENDSVENGTADYNRESYLKKHLWSMHKAIW